jgi:hypothetical protein
MKSISLASLLLLAASSIVAQAPGASAAVAFPKAFVVEHQHVETEADGSTFTTDPVTDYYGGSWLVSVHANGSRVILNFARREITEVDAAKGTYWTLTFRQMGDLRRRLQKAEERPAATSPQPSRSAQAIQKPEIRIEEVPETANSTGRTARSASAAGRPGLRHIKASAKGAPAVEVWVDPALPLGPAALTAIESFEHDAVGSTVSSDVRTASELESAARRAGAGVPVRTRRSPAEGASGSFEDVALRAEPLAALPQNLLKIDEGFRRVSSPLENMVAFSEEEASRDSSRRTK